MIKNYLKKQQGIMVTDAIIAILIMMLFLGIITSLMYNIVLETTKTKISGQQVGFITEIFEYIEKCDYEEVTVVNIIDYINSNFDTELVSGATDIAELTTKYKIGITITPYNELEGNEDKYNFIKLIELKVQADISDKTYTTEISTVKKVTIQEAEEIVNK